MHMVGVVAIVAGLVEWLSRRGSPGRGLACRHHRQPLIVGGYGDVAPRDFVVLRGALTLAGRAGAFSGRDASAPQRH
jgi:hypothetical protein